jgi:hypothetical protein
MSDLWYNVGLTDEELTELILLIDDEPVDEEFLSGIRKKLSHKRKLLRKKQSKRME